LSSPTYHPTLVISSPGLTLRLDEVAVSDCGAVIDLAPGEARVIDGKLTVGCAAGSALLLKRARVIANAELPSEWSRAVDNLGRSSVRVDSRRADQSALTNVADEEVSRNGRRAIHYH
jgi:hypothetical protein